MDMDMGGYFRFILALIFVIGLIALLAAMARRAGWGFPAAAIKRASNRRLGIVEVTPLDGRRRLILVRRDDTEHLLLVGPTSELLIETGIAGQGADFRQALATAALPAADDSTEGRS
jgi:flagellar protein FliO/FliZ|tara:strand:- start:2915 stop:3265 length:351 start_codon:yes stop_codon:yes gene_type:complete